MKSDKEIVLSGTIIHGDEFEILEGYLCMRSGIIREIGIGQVDADLSGIISPCFVNAHTHIGDSILKDPPYVPLRDLVGPSGLKHKILENARPSDLVDGMRRSLLDMVATGTCAFADFREGGDPGIEMLIEAERDIPIISRILGRPTFPSHDLHKICWGLGLSSTKDHPIDWIEEASLAARRSGKAVAIHAGEADRGDIRDALRLDPDILIHLTKASSHDIEMVASRGASAVICLGSNLTTGVGIPKLSLMLKLGILVGVGTDNVMLNSPDIFSEMKLLSKVLLRDDRQVFKMCTLNGARILGIDEKVGSIVEGKEGRIVVLDGLSNNMWGWKDPIASIVRRARSSDILAVF